MIRRSVVPSVLLLAGGLVTACAGAPEAETAQAAPSDAFPVTLINCDHEVVVNDAPQRVVTLNQGATEVVLALGLEDRLAGTAYLDDAVSSRWTEAYEAVPVLAAEYPTYEVIRAAEPDLVYASYASAFDKEVAGDRPALAGLGAASYLSSFGCPQEGQRPEPTFDAVWQELTDIATLLGAPDRATALIEEQERTLAEVRAAAPAAGLKVMWFDSGDKTPLVGGGTGGPQLILDAVGAQNMFATIDRGWGEGSWEDVIAADPDVIVLADSSWSTAEEKRGYLQQDPVLGNLSAVKEGALVTVAYSEATPGVRMVDGAKAVADQISDLGLTP